MDNPTSTLAALITIAALSTTALAYNTYTNHTLLERSQKACAILKPDVEQILTHSTIKTILGDETQQIQTSATTLVHGFCADIQEQLHWTRWNVGLTYTPRLDPEATYMFASSLNRVAETCPTRLKTLAFKEGFINTPDAVDIDADIDKTCSHFDPKAHYIDDNSSKPKSIEETVNLLADTASKLNQLDFGKPR